MCIGPQPDAICRVIGPAITYFSSMRSVIGPLFILRYVLRNLRAESAVPQEAIYSARESARTGENGVFSVTLGALNPSSLRRISPSPSP